LVRAATTIGKLQHVEYLKPPFLDTCEWAIRLVFPDTVTYNEYNKKTLSLYKTYLWVYEFMAHEYIPMKKFIALATGYIGIYNKISNWIY